MKLFGYVQIFCTFIAIKDYAYAVATTRVSIE